MGLLQDAIGGVLAGKAAAATSAPGQHMSPLMKALLLLLAAKAAHSYFGKDDPAKAPADGGAPAKPSGKIETGILAGLPNLDTLLGHFRKGGHDDKVESWIGAGPNKTISAGDLETTLGPDAIKQLEAATGLPRDKLMTQLSDALPKVIDRLTPEGRLPNEAERAKW